MSANVIQPSFSAGELSPSMFGRVDLARYHVGAATMRNFFVDYRGGSSSRAGTKYCGTCKYGNRATRIVKFQFSSDVTQSFALEFGDLYMRVIYQGGYVLTGGGAIFELTTPYVAADVFVLKFNQADDVVTITHQNYPHAILSRTAPNAWTLVPIQFGSALGTVGITGATVHGGLPANAGSTTPYVPPTFNRLYSYRITALNDNGDEGPASLPFIVAGGDIQAAAGSVQVTWGSVPGATSYNIYKFTAGGGAGVMSVGANHGFVGNALGLSWYDNNIAPDFSHVPRLHRDPFAPDSITAFVMTSGGTGYTNGSTNGVPVTVSDPSGSGFIGYGISDGSAVDGVYIEDPGTDYTAPVAHFAGAGTGAAASVSTSPAAGTYPGTSSYYQSRKVFACTLNQPATLWGTRPGLFSNMDVSNPVQDDDAYSFTLSGQQVNSIRFMIQMPGGLVIFTTGGVWQLSGGANDIPVTPSNVKAVPQSYTGCGDVAPIVINYDLIYTKESIVRALAYNIYANIYASTDLTQFSNHLFAPHTIVDWAYAEEPFKIIWCVRDDGTMLSLTYLKDEQIEGWARHDTKGLFKSCCTIRENLGGSIEDVIYLIVQRTVNGQQVQFVERMASRIFENFDTPWCLDAALATTLVYPSAGLVCSAVAGNGVTFTADSAVFAVGNVGQRLRMNGGLALITAFTDTTHLVGNWLVPQTNVLTDANTDGQIPLPAANGAWSLTPAVMSVSGVDHLDGELVQVVGDASQQNSKIVSAGAIALDVPASYVIAGIPYLPQLQTLDLDTGDPTIQGKRKKIVAATVRYKDSRGIFIGEDFATLIEEKTTRLMLGVPTPLFTGDTRTTIGSSYNTLGRICFQQNSPFPVTVLAVIPEIVVGDT